MARPLRIQYPGAYYHVTCRGNERRKIFADAADHEVFLERLSTSLETYHVVLMAYVCMTNHFHVLVSTPEGNLAEFMRHFNISYTSAFNTRHNRVGHLYQGAGRQSDHQ
jgi:putative transposase